MKFSYLALCFSLVASGCGGGGSSPSPSPAPSPAPAPAQPPGGLYIGYYQEDPINNPENPEPGSFYLYLPDGDADFAGEMSFTYFGCQSSNVGRVSGTKSQGALAGDWAGTADGVPLGGPYSGTYDSAAQRYSGTYTNRGGKVRIVVPDCADYHAAAYGTWEMAPVTARSPSDFAITVSGGNVTWTDVAGATQWLASVYDEAKARTGGDAVVKQTVLDARSTGSENRSVPLAVLGMEPGRAYVLAITGFSASHLRVGYTALRYTAP